MKTVVHNTPAFSFVCLEDVFSSDILDNFWKEIDYLYNTVGLQLPGETGQQNYNEEVGLPMKSNTGIFISQVCPNVEDSIILSETYRILEDSNFIDRLSIGNSKFKELHNIKLKTSLFNYYTNYDYYYPHVDASDYTFVFWMYKEPKAFSGGKLVLPSLNLEIECKNNTAILFPSNVEHGVTEIIMPDPKPMHGRISISTFMVKNSGVE